MSRLSKAGNVMGKKSESNNLVLDKEKEQVKIKS